MGSKRKPDTIYHQTTLDLLDRLRAEDNKTNKLYKIKFIDFSSKQVALLDKEEEKNISWIKWHNFSKRGTMKLLFIDKEIKRKKELQ